MVTVLVLPWTSRRSQCSNVMDLSLQVTGRAHSNLFCSTSLSFRTYQNECRKVESVDWGFTQGSEGMRWSKTLKAEGCTQLASFNHFALMFWSVPCRCLARVPASWVQHMQGQRRQSTGGLPVEPLSAPFTLAVLPHSLVPPHPDCQPCSFLRRLARLRGADKPRASRHSATGRMSTVRKRPGAPPRYGSCRCGAIHRMQTTQLRRLPREYARSALALAAFAVEAGTQRLQPQADTRQAHVCPVWPPPHFALLAQQR